MYYCGPKLTELIENCNSEIISKKELHEKYWIGDIVEIYNVIMVGNALEIIHENNFLLNFNIPRNSGKEEQLFGAIIYIVNNFIFDEVSSFEELLNLCENSIKEFYKREIKEKISGLAGPDIVDKFYSLIRKEIDVFLNEFRYNKKEVDNYYLNLISDLIYDDYESKVEFGPEN
jgi:hypothetical protein